MNNILKLYGWKIINDIVYNTEPIPQKWLRENSEIHFKNILKTFEQLNIKESLLLFLCICKIKNYIPLEIFRKMLNTQSFWLSQSYIDKYKYKGKAVLRKQPFYRDPNIVDKTHPTLPNFTNIQVCSNTKKGKLLSPMYIGPVKYIENNKEYTIPVFENFWQNLKVYTHELDKNGNPSQLYFIRRNKNWLDTIPHRRVYPKKYLLENNSRIEYVYYKNKKYDKASSKKEIYCEMYSELIKNNKYFLELKERLKQGENLLILGFDGFTFDPEVDDFNVFEREDIIVGHEFVILCMLLDKYPWKD